MGVKWFVCLFAVWSVCSLVEADDKPFLPCPSERITESCGARCRETMISLTYTNGYSSSNVLCMDSNSADGYILQGCPFDYYDSSLTTEVCKIAADNNGTDLLLTASDLGPGAYSFHCVLSPDNRLSVTSYVLVANDSNPYSKVLVYINGELQQRRRVDSASNITLNRDDNLTIAILAVGNVSVINASGERFVCETGFACNGDTLNDVKNRYLQCSLRFPANVEDDGETLRIYKDNTQLTDYTIIMNEGPLLQPSLSTSAVVISPTATVTDATDSQDTMGSSTSVEPSSSDIVTTTVMTTVITATAGTPYSTVTGIDTIPTSTSTDSGPSEHSSDPVVAMVAGITASIGALIALVGILAIVYWRCKKKHSQVAMKPREVTALNAYKVLSYSCPHCDKLDQQIKDNGYTVHKLPNKQLTDAYKKEASLGKSVPVIVCGYPECKVSCSLLESSPVPENWNVLRLNVTSDENPDNERLTTMNCTDLGKEIPIIKVLEWLDRVSWRGSITSTDGNMLGEIDKNVKILVDRTEAILEKQDQANTSLSAIATNRCKARMIQ